MLRSICQPDTRWIAGFEGGDPPGATPRPGQFLTWRRTILTNGTDFFNPCLPGSLYASAWMDRMVQHGHVTRMLEPTQIGEIILLDDLTGIQADILRTALPSPSQTLPDPLGQREFLFLSVFDTEDQFHRYAQFTADQFLARICIAPEETTELIHLADALCDHHVGVALARAQQDPDRASQYRAGLHRLDWEAFDRLWKGEDPHG